jgi:hypothetical protein
MYEPILKAGRTIANLNKTFLFRMKKGSFDCRLNKGGAGLRLPLSNPPDNASCFSL